MTGPSSVSFGATATYTLITTNTGSGTAPQVIVTDAIPAGAAFVSSTPSVGSCTLLGASLTCNLGTMSPSSSATITLVLKITAQSTNQAVVQAKDAGGNPIADPTSADNSASVTTTLNTPPTTTDIQGTGSAQNGGPAAGQIDTYTWQIKNGGSQVANAVVFTDVLPSTLQFASASTASPGSCTGHMAGSQGGSVTCTIGSLAVGKTMLVTVNVTPLSPGSIATTGSAAFNGTDSNGSNNSFTVVISVK